MPEHKIILTEDGSHSVFSNKYGTAFHSKHGALKESQHVFIKSGLLPLIEGGKSNIRILEAGLGTGSSALLTALLAGQHNVQIEYVALEAYPISSEIVESLNYIDLLEHKNAAAVFQKIHNCPWEDFQNITSHFSLQKCQKSFLEFQSEPCFDLIYFDAFDPKTQPELWTTDALRRFVDGLKPGGTLTTYSAKGAVRRSFMELGCRVEKMAGPPGKREMIRVWKGE